MDADAVLLPKVDSPADLDALAIEPLVKTLTDDDIDVARTAYDLLSQSQNGWTVLAGPVLGETIRN